MDDALTAISRELGEVLVGHGWTLVTAESCTGGWVAEVVTATAGSSAWFDRGFVTYSNSAKEEMLGVSSATLQRFGAVSEQTVAEMAVGALTHSHAKVAVSVSGIAGPDGGSVVKPVGTICIAWALPDRECRSETVQFHGNRESVRRQAVLHALRTLVALSQGWDGA